MSHYSKKNLGLPANPVAGFTLIELMVSISIIVIILTVVISGQSTYTDKAALAGLADEISLTISQAQIYSIGVKELSTGSLNFSSSYGLTFSLLGGTSGSNTAYIYFADINRDFIYAGDWSCVAGGECLSKTDIVRGNLIQSICVVPVSGADVCDVGRADISFVRPNTEAQLRFFNLSGGVYNPISMKGVKIRLVSPKGATRSVSVFTTGQISVQ